MPFERRRRTLDDVPQRELLTRSVRLYLVGALVWDYTDSVLALAAQMKNPATKALTRAVRALRLDYDRVRAQDLDRAYITREWELAEKFEDINSDAFIRRYCPEAPHSILPDHFRRLAILLPEYAGDCYDRYSEARRLTARTLLNRINQIELYD